MSILEANRPWSNEIKERVKNADSDEIMKYFEENDLSQYDDIVAKSMIIE